MLGLEARKKMLRRNQRSIAALTVVFTIAVSAGGAVTTPVAAPVNANKLETVEP